MRIFSLETPAIRERAQELDLQLLGHGLPIDLHWGLGTNLKQS